MGASCIVCEGGAMRGNYAAGVLDYLMINDLPEADCIVGVSAGELCALSYKSRQIGRTVRVNTTFCNDWRYLSLRSYAVTGDAFGREFVFEKVHRVLDPIDAETFACNPVANIAVVTDLETGKALYLDVADCLRDTELIRASASMPLVSAPIEYGGHKLLDGGVADSIPVMWALEQGFDRILVVLTQDRAYTKQRNQMMPLISHRYHDYPQFVETMRNRHVVYNVQRELCFDLETSGDVFVVAPSEPLKIRHMESDSGAIMQAYNLGLRDAAAAYPRLADYWG